MSATSNRILSCLAISAASVLVLGGCATANKSAESAPAATGGVVGTATSGTATVPSSQFLKGLEVAERPELEPDWGPFVKQNFPSWRKHYWVDRGQWGNRGYIVGQPPTVPQPSVQEEPMPPVIVPSEAPNVETPAKPMTYTVKKGDCLWKIAGKVYNNPFKWGRIYRANKGKIKNPNRIYPNQVLTIPWD